MLLLSPLLSHWLCFWLHSSKSRHIHPLWGSAMMTRSLPENTAFYIFWKSLCFHLFYMKLLINLIVIVCNQFPYLLDSSKKIRVAGNCKFWIEKQSNIFGRTPNWPPHTQAFPSVNRDFNALTTIFVLFIFWSFKGKKAHKFHKLIQGGDPSPRAPPVMRQADQNRFFIRI